jgi:hypothetical protein
MNIKKNSVYMDIDRNICNQEYICSECQGCIDIYHLESDKMIDDCTRLLCICNAPIISYISHIIQEELQNPDFLRNNQCVCYRCGGCYNECMTYRHNNKICPVKCVCEIPDYAYIYNIMEDDD